MIISRVQLKKSILVMLDMAALPHPMGNQDAYAARYIVKASSGRELELMFQKDPKSPPNLWCLSSVINTATKQAVEHKEKKASQLYTTISEATGKPQYGRHSALEKMPQLGQSDLLCFKLGNLQQLERILACLKAS